MTSTDPASLRSWARGAVVAFAEAGETEPSTIVAAVTAAVEVAVVGDRSDPDASVAAGVGDALVPLPARVPEPPRGWSDPWLPGLVHEQAVAGTQRSARGAWYTPEPVVRGLVALATDDGRAPAAVHDPTCGGGAFLLAALDRLVSLGVAPERALARVSGGDSDPLAVAVSRAALALWAAGQGLSADPATLPVVERDALTATVSTVGDDDRPSPDASIGDAVAGPLVIGNPPFATPLRTGRLTAEAEAIRAANRDLLGPYGDLAAIHLLASLRSVGPGGTVALVLPQSVLAGRDTRGLRVHTDRAAPLQALWASREAVFDAGVRACAVVLAIDGEPPAVVRLAAGPEVTPVRRCDPDPIGPDRWADHAARALGAPTLPADLLDAAADETAEPSDAVWTGPPHGRRDRSAVTRRRHGRAPGRLGDLVSATAGFRDEYYGLVAACCEWEGELGEEPNRLVTVGTVDPLESGWGLVPCRFGGRRWRRPTVDVDALEPKVARWVGERLVPKVVLATQSRILEPAVDRRGRLVPATPLLALDADPDDLDRVAAILLAPPVVAWAWQRWFGTALSVDALKLAARQVPELPLPPDVAAWDDAAAAVAAAEAAPPGERPGEVDRVASVMNAAYGAGPEVLGWWRNRRSRRRSSPTG
ncbi:MAG: N-6 DNA methylase [Actinomycetota bacterium]